jgi:hypothetical protein
MEKSARIKGTRFACLTTMRAGVEKAHVVLISVAVSFVFAIEAVAQKRPAAEPRRKKELLRREQVRQAEERLAALGYWTGPVDGRFDGASRAALIAFQKVEGRTPAGRLTTEEFEAVIFASQPEPFERGYAHVEIDLERQVLLVVEEKGIVSKILPVSTGNGESFTSEGWTRKAVTPCGRFTVHRKLRGWHKSPLGMLYYPSHIVGGIAIHGSPSVPVHPASHGCIRIPMFAAKEFSEMTPVGTTVIVHGCSPP